MEFLLKKSRRRTTTPGYLAFLLAMCFMGPSSFGFVIYNTTSYDVDVQVTPGDFVETISPGENKACNWSNTDCNPSGSRTAQLLLIIEVDDGNNADYAARLSLQAGGYALIYEVDRSSINLAGRPDFRVDSWTYDHNLNDSTRTGHSDGGVGMEAPREVRFFATADCQYHGEAGTTHAARNDVADDVYLQMSTEMLLDPKIRGIIFAGDLTNDSRQDEWAHYNAMIGASKFIFDGLGNHDVNYPTPDQIAQCIILPHRCRIPDTIIGDVGDRQHQTAKTAKDFPHYSWDWQDVHFVQLNIFPGDEPASDWQPDGDNNIYPDLDPMESLTFLQNDLAANVGASGRPVVLIHHYGFDDFSIGGGASRCGVEPDEPYTVWWTPEQRLKYWNVIKGYNIAGIFSGHLHGPRDATSPDAGCRWYIEWNRPAGASGGPSSIPTFIAGASRIDFFLDVTMSDGNQMKVTRRSTGSTWTETVCIDFGYGFYVDDDASAPGWGAAGLPFASIDRALQSVARRDASCSGGVRPDIRLAPGTYNQSLTLDQKIRLTATGAGSARIGAQ